MGESMGNHSTVLPDKPCQFTGNKGGCCGEPYCLSSEKRNIYLHVNAVLSVCSECSLIYSVWPGLQWVVFGFMAVVDETSHL